MSKMDERVWYYYSGQAQVGPITEDELRQQISDKALSASDYVYRDGFEDWKLLADVADLLKGASDAPKDRRSTSPRAPIYELVVAHNDRHIATGTLRNISVTGVFFETKDATFNLEEEIKLTLKEGRGLGKPLHLRGVIVRKSTDERYPQGYGLELKGLDSPTQSRIADYIRRNQQAS